MSDNCPTCGRPFAMPAVAVYYSRSRLVPHLDEIIARRKTGETLQQIADNFGVTREAIRVALAQVGVIGKQRVSLTEFRRFFHAVGVVARLEGKAQRGFPHGHTGYSYGCRCDACRAANHARHKALLGRAAPSHGISGYRNYGCRCDVCKRAGSLDNRRQRERRKARVAA